MIELENVVKRYGDFVAVNGVSLRVQPGEIFGFLGVNGAGKTTTIRMMAGVLRPTSGRIRLCGYDIVDESNQAKRLTGYIPDRPHMYAKLTAREFLYFTSDLYGMSAKDSERRIDELLETYQLTQWQDELVESFSHGMKQRLATCAALVHTPKILIVDEPMVGLDPHGAKLLKDELRRYAREGMVIFLSTHSLNVAEEVADRLAIIDRGKIITTGTLDDIRRLVGNHEEGLEEMFLGLTAYTNIDAHH